MAGGDKIHRRIYGRKSLKIEGFRGEIREKEPLNNHTTWKVGGVAKYLFSPTDFKDLELAVLYCVKNAIPYVMLGNGSNVLFPDEGFDGIVIKTTGGLKERCIIKNEGDGAILYFGAGNLVGEIINFTVRNGLSGIEFLAGIPASFGGVLKMNAGAFNSEIMQFVEWINFFSETDGFVTMEKKYLQYGYRKLETQNGYIISGAAVKLIKDTPEKIMERIKGYHSRKTATQPLNEPTCGSVFKNPAGDYAGRIIEELGLKGFQVGGAKVSEKHANFIVNTGKATAKDILTLIETIKQKVWLKKQLVLEEEVVIINKNKGTRAKVI